MTLSGSVVPPTGGGDAVSAHDYYFVKTKQLKQAWRDPKWKNPKVPMHGYVFSGIYEPAYYRHDLENERQRHLRDQFVPRRSWDGVFIQAGVVEDSGGKLTVLRNRMTSIHVSAGWQCLRER